MFDLSVQPPEARDRQRDYMCLRARAFSTSRRIRTPTVYSRAHPYIRRVLRWVCS